MVSESVCNAKTKKCIIVFIPRIYQNIKHRFIVIVTYSFFSTKCKNNLIDSSFNRFHVVKKKFVVTGILSQASWC